MSFTAVLILRYDNLYRALQLFYRFRVIITCIELYKFLAALETMAHFEGHRRRYERRGGKAFPVLNASRVDLPCVCCFLVLMCSLIRDAFIRRDVFVVTLWFCLDSFVSSMTFEMINNTVESVRRVKSLCGFH